MTWSCASEEKLTFCEDNKLIHSLLEEVSTGDISFFDTFSSVECFFSSYYELLQL